MADVFISYARKDLEFVRRLVAALEAGGRSVWVDTEGIEPSDRWWQSVTEAIDAADSFLFVLSPESLSSTDCLRELDHAASEHKRVIGVVWHDVEDLSAPRAVSEVNWVFLRDADAFEAEFAKLERALDLDLELVRVHTSVLTRARDWNSADARSSALLRGADLRRAEQWLARAAAGAQPKPTDMQAAFVLESRRRTSRRQRLTVAGSLFAAMLALGLAAFALIQRSQASHQAHVAQSRALATRSEATLATDDEAALRLAVQSVGVQPSAQAVHALWHALDASRLRISLGQPSPIESVAFSPNGDTLATGDDQGVVRLWRLADRHLLWSVGRGEAPATGITFARAGDVLAVGRNSIQAATSCAVDVLSVSTGMPKRVLGPAVGCRRFVGFLGATRTLAVGDTTGALRLWDVDSGRQVGGVGGLQTPVGGVVPPGGGNTFEMGFRPDGSAIAAGGNDDAVRVVSVPGGQPIAQIAGQSLLKPDGFAFSPDGARLLIASRNGAVVDDIGPDHVTQTADQIEQAVVDGVAWSPDGRLFADAAFADIHVWAARSNRLVETLHGPSSGLTAIAFSSQGLLAGAGRDGTVRIWAPDPDLPLRTVHSPGVALSQAGSTEHAHLAAVGSAADGVVVTNEQGGEVATLALNSAVFGGDSQFVVTSDGGLAFAQHGRLDLVKLPSGDLLRSWPLVPSTASFGITAGGGDIADVTSNGALTLLSGGRPRTTQVTVDQSFGNAPDVLLSPDQRWLAVTGAIHPAGIRILNVPSLANVRTEPGSETAFSPSGRLLAILRPDLSIAILRTSDWHLQATLLGGLSMSRGGLSFSPDERLVAQTGDGKLRTWDASDGTVLTTRYVVDDIGDTASTLSLSPPVLTDAGLAIVGASRADAVETFEVCPSCLSATALLRQARLRLLEIREARSG